jgi:hypothetical protein
MDALLNRISSMHPGGRINICKNLLDTENCIKLIFEV